MARIDEVRRVIRLAGVERVAEVADDFRRDRFGPEDAHGLAKSAPDHGPYVAKRAVLRGSVHHRDAELGIHDISAERGALDQLGKRLLAPLDRFLGPFALGDVLRQDRDVPADRNHD